MEKKTLKGAELLLEIMEILRIFTLCFVARKMCQVILEHSLFVSDLFMNASLNNIANQKQAYVDARRRR